MEIKNNEGSLIGTWQNCIKEQKSFLGALWFYLKDQKCFFLKNGHHIIVDQKGCKVWDLDGSEYIDMSIMGIGTNILGYGHPEVDDPL